MLLLSGCGNTGDPESTGIPDASDLIGTDIVTEETEPVSSEETTVTASETTVKTETEISSETSSETITATAEETTVTTTETTESSADTTASAAEYPPLEPLSMDAEQKIKADFAAFKGLTGKTAESVYIKYYYGTYGGCEVVMCSPPVNVSDEVIAAPVGDFVFNEDIMLHKDGTFIYLSNAYENGYLSDDDLRAIAHYDSIKPMNTPEAPPSEADRITLEPLSIEAEQKLKKDYISYKDWTDEIADSAFVARYYGTYNGCEVAVMWSMELVFNEMVKEVNIGGNRIMLPSGSFDLMLHKDGTFMDITAAYEEGLITDEDAETIANVKAESYLPGSRPEPLTTEAEAVLCEDYAEYATSETETFTSDDVFVLKYYGTFDGCEVVIMNCRELPYSPAPKTISVDGYALAMPSEDMELLLHRDSSFIDIRFAYENGYLTEEDIVLVEKYIKNMP